MAVGAKIQIKVKATRLTVDKMYLFIYVDSPVLSVSKTSSDNSIALALCFNILRIT